MEDMYYINLDEYDWDTDEDRYIICAPHGFVYVANEDETVTVFFDIDVFDTRSGETRCAFIGFSNCVYVPIGLKYGFRDETFKMLKEYLATRR